MREPTPEQDAEMDAEIAAAVAQTKAIRRALADGVTEAEILARVEGATVDDIKEGRRTLAMLELEPEVRDAIRAGASDSALLARFPDFDAGMLEILRSLVGQERRV